MEFIFEVCVMFGLKRAGTILVEKLGIKRKTLEKNFLFYFYYQLRKMDLGKSGGNFVKEVLENRAD
jgi:hypothetical protein